MSFTPIIWHSAEKIFRNHSWALPMTIKGRKFEMIFSILDCNVFIQFSKCPANLIWFDQIWRSRRWLINNSAFWTTFHNPFHKPCHTILIHVNAYSENHYRINPDVNFFTQKGYKFANCQTVFISNGHDQDLGAEIARRDFGVDHRWSRMS